MKSETGLRGEVENLKKEVEALQAHVHRSPPLSESDTTPVPITVDGPNSTSSFVQDAPHAHGTHVHPPVWPTVPPPPARLAAPRQSTLNRHAAKTYRKESSRYNAPSPPKASETDRSPLTGRPRVKVLFVGNIDPNCDATSMAEHCKENGVSIVQSVFYSSESHRTAYARLTVLATDAEKVSEESFWPPSLSFSVRPWKFSSDPRGTGSNSKYD